MGRQKKKKNSMRVDDAVFASLSIGVGLVQIMFTLCGSSQLFQKNKSAQRISVCASSTRSWSPYNHFKVMIARTYCLPKRHAFARLLSLSL
jgi:hypothetical protein